MHRPRLIFALLLAAACLGCAGAARQADWEARTAVAAPQLALFQLPTSLELGFDPIRPEAIWRKGDRVLYGVRLLIGEEERRWFVRFTLGALPVADPQAAADPRLEGFKVRSVPRTHRVHKLEERRWEETYYQGQLEHRVEVFDHCGELLHETRYTGSAYAHYTQSHLSSGLLATLMQVMQMVQSVPLLDGMLKEVARPPSLWSMLSHRGLALSLSVDPRKGQPSAVRLPRLGELAAEELVIPLDANGQPALNARIQYTWKQSPLLYCQGLVSLRGWHPDDPGKEFWVQLLGARRGPSL